jgi:hypothetical protein
MPRPLQLGTAIKGTGKLPEEITRYMISTQRCRQQLKRCPSRSVRIIPIPPGTLRVRLCQLRLRTPVTRHLLRITSVLRDVLLNDSSSGLHIQAAHVIHPQPFGCRRPLPQPQKGFTKSNDIGPSRNEVQAMTVDMPTIPK